ncbi:HlyD family secretion protein [Gemmobacter megaterium]|uniref:HlyD family secretion protein n=1 Tax=Gemmobacter megaterium TaxID=1086013 RepID=A0A1N7K291_9RHOB|nr:efflux RND transporter periplasmic adaptor subunit [Gemmobacter megaterium]GGE00025.1 hemolysin D [Gemmobacter megaterium]SIS55656.1 HlyD family secretion protein [Gemmobacter megaterium]
MTPRSIPSIALVLVMATVGHAPQAVLAETATALAAGAPAPVLPAITVSPVKVASLSDRIFAGGLVQALETVQVAPLIEGQPIDALLADVGDRVAEGQVLARLSKTTLDLNRSQLLASVAAARATVAQAEAQVLEAEASSDEARRVADRARALREGGNASQAALDQAQTSAMAATARVTVARQSLEAARAQLTSTEAQLANVELNLNRTDVVAPVAGAIVARNAQVGAIASAAGQPMFTLMRDGALELRVELAERDLIRIAPGQTAQLRVAGASRVLSGTVRLVEPTVDQATRLGHARIRLEEPGILVSGMFADAEILVARRMGLAVPVTAVSTDPAGATVMRVDAQGHVSRVTVETGIRDGGMVEIVSGLTGGDRVVTKAGAFVRDGDRVNPVLAATN